MKFCQVALLGAAALAVAQPHVHNHAHLHAGRHASPVEARAPVEVTETVPGPTETVYQLNGVDVSYAEVQAGLANGKFILVGESIPTVIPPPPAPSSTSSSSEFSAAQFFQKPSPIPEPTTTAAPIPTPTPSSTSVAPAAASSDASSNAPVNIGTQFPNNTEPCSSFPSEYGPVPVEWLGLGGWIGVQEVPEYTPGDHAISFISTAIAGEGCKPNSFCSYACPAGYQKSQWPSAQGSTGQSIGGIFCNADGNFVLNDNPYLCIPGAGGVYVKNNLGEGQNVCVCRTDYPGTEGETVPLNVLPGQNLSLTNPDSATYYQWEGAPTTAQYYINPSGVDCSQACVWGSAGSNLGNWAPVNAGVGLSKEGTTFISLFPNIPTNPDGKLDYTISITGASGECIYSDGSYTGSPNGCTVRSCPTFSF
jgi:hypothetical protein